MMDDIDRIMRVMDCAFDPQWGEAWNRRQVSDALTLPNTHYLLVSANGEWPGEGEEAAGFTMVRAAPGEEELLLVAVQPDHRGKGLGRLLLQRVTEEARRREAEHVFLEMRSNNPAESLYRLHGFEPIGRRKDYYRLADGSRIDAITFKLSV
ncbi:MAG: GNAT family N-acetyltransferase [Sphingomonadaceae bacterium]|nr:GNAT family N-acetyltransferase [Sphingomonadaceae bacterium]